MKPVALSTILYSYIHEEGMYDNTSINDFRDDNDLLKEQPIVYDITEVISTPDTITDPTYIRWKIFNEILEPVYTTIKHLTDGEQVDIDANLEYYDENGDYHDINMKCDMKLIVKLIKIAYRRKIRL